MPHQYGFNHYVRQLAVCFGYPLVDNRMVLSDNLAQYWGFLVKRSHVY
jgi:hypothetical protein